MDDKELSYGEIITLNAFWETCLYYIKKHKEKDLEVRVFSFAKNNAISLYKQDELWYFVKGNEVNEYADCYTACTDVLRYMALTKEEESELLKIYTNNIQTGYSKDEIEKGSKVFKKC